MNITNRMLLQTHRGRPHLVMSPVDAEERGIVDEEEVRVHNDVGDFLVRVKLSPSVMPGQVICYNGWDPYQFREWRGPMDVEPGMVKWLHMAGGYGHLRYWPIQWQPTPVDRAVRVDVAKIETKTSSATRLKEAIVPKELLEATKPGPAAKKKAATTRKGSVRRSSTRRATARTR